MAFFIGGLIAGATAIWKGLFSDRPGRQRSARCCGASVLGLFLPLAASMLGGLIGSQVWPRRDTSDPETVRLRT